MLAYFGLVVVITAIVLTAAHGQPHGAAASDEAAPSAADAATSQPLTPQQATQKFPPAEVAKLRAIVQDSLKTLQGGNQSGATTRIKDLETAWDADSPTLQPLDSTAWHFLDGQIDVTLTSLRANHPNPAAELNALTGLLQSLS